MEKSTKEVSPIAQDKNTISLSNLLDRFDEDQSPLKCNLIPGPFNDSGKRVYNFSSTRKAKKDVILENRDKDYIPMVGDAKFNSEAQRLIFGNSTLISEDKIVTIQTISGSGALWIILKFLKQFKQTDLYIPNFTWENHKRIADSLGQITKTYPFFDPEKRTLSFHEMFATLSSINSGSVVLLHTSAFNPAGVEPSQDQWRALAQLFKARGLIPIFDCAGQGLVSGKLERDIQSIKTFLEEDTQFIVVQSLANSLGIFGEMIGALHVVCRSKEIKDKVLDQLKIIFRTTYSNPPCHGAWVATKLLTNQEYKTEWENELEEVANKFKAYKQRFYEMLKGASSNQNWEYIQDQPGPYFYLGLTEEEREVLEREFHIYLSPNGCVSVEDIEESNISRIIESISHVRKETKSSSKANETRTMKDSKL